MDLQPGDFIFFKTQSFSGRIIRSIQRKIYGDVWYTNCNHIAVCLETPDIIREAIIPKTIIHPYEDFKKQRDIMAIVRPLYIDSSPELLKKLLHKEFFIYGQYYGILNVVGMGIMGLMLILGATPKKNYIRTGRICTEDAYMFKVDFEKAYGIPTQPVCEPSSLFIADLGKMFDFNPYYKTIFVSGY